jgi:cell fate regulator YaaT (PSP1 superfamily)
LKILKPVNMKMAKLQKATLDPSKISGYCGRLKCCLRYEDHTYRDLVKRLPRKRSRVRTPHGDGFVIDAQILTQLVCVRTDDGNVFAVPVEEIVILDPQPQQPVSNRQDEGDEYDEKPTESTHGETSPQEPDIDQEYEIDDDSVKGTEQ